VEPLEPLIPPNLPLWFQNLPERISQTLTPQCDYHRYPEIKFQDKLIKVKVAQHLPPLGLDAWSSLLLVCLEGVTGLAFFAQIMERNNVISQL